MKVTAKLFPRRRAPRRHSPLEYQLAAPRRSASRCRARLPVLAACVLFTAAPPAVAASDGAEIAKRCDQCHGAAGRSEQPDVPSIGGFSEFAILDLMETYRAGLRAARLHALPDGTETDMVEVSRALTPQESEAVARHYAAQTWRPHVQEFDPALARRGALIHDLKCSRCHSEGGSVPEDDLAIMAGQWREYLKMEFADFDRGTRRMADKMKVQYDTLSADDKKALIELYVSAGNY